MSRTAWTRLWSVNRSSQLDHGLQARMADPLWMLARQWQFGAFHGDDAVSPAEVLVESETREVTALSSGGPGGTKTPLGAGDLLEPIVEAEQAENGPAAIHMAGVAGLQFLRRLPDALRPAVLAYLQDDTPLPRLRDAHPATPDKSLRRLAALRLGSFDARMLGAGKIDASMIADAAQVPLGPVEQALQDWLGYYGHRFQPAPEAPTWRDERMEYAVTVEAVADDTRISLSAHEYPGGHLDWSAFDIASASGNAKIAGRKESASLLPSPIQFSGQQAERLWDFEDGKVFFGGLRLDTADLAQVVLTEFATIYGNDWFMVPVPTSPGTLNRITRIVVRDAFGERTVIPPAATTDADPRPFRFFELKNDPSIRQGMSPWVYLPRTVAGGEESRPVEEVVLTRDEAANLAWGVERVIEDASGNPANRERHWARIRDAIRAEAEAEAETLPETLPVSRDGEAAEPPWRYKLLTSPPPFWVPFLPEVDGNLPTGRLLRARLREWDLLGEARDALAGAQGRILTPRRPLAVLDDELCEGGLIVLRSYQSSRAPDGRLILWAARRKGPTRFAESAGRETDKIEKGRKR